MPSQSGWIRLFEPLVNLVVERPCPLCDRPAAGEFCRDCARQIQGCQWDQLAAPGDGLAVFAWGRYGGTLKRAIAALKYEGQTHLAQPLGHWMGRAWLQANPAESLCVIPIPMHRDKEKKRGFNQAERLATHFCQITRLPLERQALLRIRATEAQFGLSAEQRAQNLAGAMQVSPTWKPPRYRQVLLLDDIYTTGATVRAAAQVLQQEGIGVYGVMALARAEREGREGDRIAIKPKTQNAVLPATRATQHFGFWV